MIMEMQGSDQRLGVEVKGNVITYTGSIDRWNERQLLAAAEAIQTTPSDSPSRPFNEWEATGANNIYAGGMPKEDIAPLGSVVLSHIARHM